MRKLLFFSIVLLHLQVYAQLETANWYFGQFLGLNFLDNQVTPLSDGQIYTGEGCATISDSEGNLLFYTDGSKVYNRRHQLMLNGVGLYGDSSSTQSAIIIPFPGDTTKYIIFTVSADDSASPTYTTNRGFNYYFVDMTLDNGYGGVIIPDQNKLLDISSEKVAAVKHINRKDYWVVTHFGGKFYAYLINETGVVNQPVVSEIGPYIDPRTYPVNSRGYLSLSPNGKKLAIAHLSHLNYDLIPFHNLPSIDQLIPTNGLYSNSYPGYLALYDFNKATGRVTNEVVLDTTGSPYGVQFSPNSKVLYASVDYHSIDTTTNVGTWIRGELNQYNLNVEANQIAGTKRTLRTYTTLDTSSQIFTARGALQLALNQRIYYSRSDKTFLSHIKDPNNVLNPQFEEVGVAFPLGNWNFHTNYGLPPFISSSFETDILLNGSDIKTFCLGQSIQFQFTNADEVTILGYQWELGDGNISTLASPVHIYTQPGVYTIQLKINSLEYGELIYEIHLTVYPSIDLTPAVLEACDADLDGRVTFDLNDAQSQLSEVSGLIYNYYPTITDAENETNELTNLYPSNRTSETIYVRVSNAIGCYDISTIQLNHLQGSHHQLESKIICTEGSELSIRLNDYNAWVRTQLPDLTIADIKFYTNLNDANTETNAIQFVQIHNEPITIYAVIEQIEQSCKDLVQFQLIPSFIPEYELSDLFKCKEETRTVTAPAGYTYQWEGLTGQDALQDATQQQIMIQNAGQYQLKLTNEYGCNRIIQFQVNDYDPIEIIEVKVTRENEITVIANGTNLQYSLDGVIWTNENVFVNVPTGVYNVYIKSENGCVVGSDDVVIFKITNFLSPNQDLINDKWRIPGLERYDNVHVEIYNRYGKKLVDKTMHFENEIWDGRYQNKQQPSDSYWYILKIPGNLTYTGSLLLKNKL